MALCYSPSRPLQLAFKECRSKGYMCVKSVFSHDIILWVTFLPYPPYLCALNLFFIIRKLTKGMVEQRSVSNRLIAKWTGAYREVEMRMNNSCENLIIRGGHAAYCSLHIAVNSLCSYHIISMYITVDRYDMKLPDFLIDQLGIEQRLRPILQKLTSIMGTKEHSLHSLWARS